MESVKMVIFFYEVDDDDACTDVGVDGSTSQAETQSTSQARQKRYEIWSAKSKAGGARQEGISSEHGAGGLLQEDLRIAFS